MLKEITYYKPKIILEAIKSVETETNKYFHYIFRMKAMGRYTEEQAHGVCKLESEYTKRFVEKYLLPFQNEAKFGPFLTQKRNATKEDFFGNILDEIQKDLFLRDETKTYLTTVITAEMANFENR